MVHARLRLLSAEKLVVVQDRSTDIGVTAVSLDSYAYAPRSVTPQEIHFAGMVARCERSQKLMLLLSGLCAVNMEISS